MERVDGSWGGFSLKTYAKKIVLAELRKQQGGQQQPPADNWQGSSWRHELGGNMFHELGGDPVEARPG